MSECQKCGRCCSELVGALHITPNEQIAIAKYRECSVLALQRMFHIETKGANADYVIFKGHLCPFFLRNTIRCGIYPVRPDVCRRYPSFDEATDCRGGAT